MKLPKYLTDIISHLARSEEKTGGMKASKALEVFRSELIDESLTAKANPSPAANPTIKPFLEIYDLLGKTFSDSPLGRALGFNYRAGRTKTYNGKNIPVNSVSRRMGTDLFSGGKMSYSVDSSEGKKFFEEMRQFAVKVSDDITRGVFGERTERTKNPLTKKKEAKSKGNASSSEYLKRPLKSLFISEDERNEPIFLAEQNRYRKLLVRSLVVGLLEPIFDLNAEDIDGLLHELMKNTNLKKASTHQSRQEFCEKVLELMRDQRGIVKATIEASEYIGKYRMSGEKFTATMPVLALEILKIKETNAPVKIIPPAL